MAGVMLERFGDQLPGAETAGTQRIPPTGLHQRQAAGGRHFDNCRTIRKQSPVGPHGLAAGATQACRR